VLRNVNLDVEAGSVVALVGPTGVGKTTLVSLIPRFYDVAQGAVTLDGADLRDITLKSLREQISIVAPSGRTSSSAGPMPPKKK